VALNNNYSLTQSPKGLTFNINAKKCLVEVEKKTNAGLSIFFK
jgi:hypothetical protein